jgi:hypothetical protein
MGGTCKDCYIYAGLTFHFSITLEDYKLQSMEAYVEGNLAANVELESLDVTGSVTANAKQVFVYHSPTIDVKFGSAKVFISAMVPVTMQPEVEATGQLKVSGGAGADLSVKAGAAIRRGSSGLERVLFEDFNAEVRAGGFSPEKFSGEAAVRMKLVAAVQFNISIGLAVGPALASIGGPLIALGFTPETVFKGEYDGETNNAEAQALISIDGAIGLDMKLEIGGEWGAAAMGDLLDGVAKWKKKDCDEDGLIAVDCKVEPKGIFSKKIPLKKKTWGNGNTNGNGRRLAEWPAATWKQMEGTTWEGSQRMHPSRSTPCDDDSFQYLTFQLVNVEDPLSKDMDPSDPNYMRGLADLTLYTAWTKGNTNAGGDAYTEVSQEVWGTYLRTQTVNACETDDVDTWTRNDVGMVIPGQGAFNFNKKDDQEGVDYFESTQGGAAGNRRIGYFCTNTDGTTRWVIEDTMRCTLIDMVEQVVPSRRLQDKEVCELSIREVDAEGSAAGIMLAGLFVLLQ